MQVQIDSLTAFEPPASAGRQAKQPLAAVYDEHTCSWQDPHDCPTCSKLMTQPSQLQEDEAEQADANGSQDEQDGTGRAKRRREKRQRRKQVH